MVVDDEHDVADIYTLWLERAGWEVRKAYSVPEARDLFDATVDVVLLDRNMPEVTGDEFLRELRAENADCRVAMVTAVDPDFDIVEMGFDEYVTKPVAREDLVATADELHSRSSYSRAMREFYAAVSKLSALESELPPEALEANETYRALREEANRLRAVADESVLTVGFSDGFQDLARLSKEAGEQ